MSESAVRIFNHTSRQPFATAPPWADKVPRWEQMGAEAGALVEAWYAWDAPLPDVFLLASRTASNLADALFARSGAISPARFVATLPSVALAPLLQATGWTGPMFCIQAGPATLATVLDEAALLLALGRYQRVGVVTFDPGAIDPPFDRPRDVKVRYYELRVYAPDARRGGRP
jgi:hypothetical protein